MKKFTLLIAVVITANLLFAQINIVDDSFYSEVLQQEMLVDVFLPPDYEANPDQYYPVVYFLHGWGGNQNSLNNYASIANTLMLNGSIDPFIMVGANNQAGPFGGTMYMNSPLWGDFETFNFTEVLNYIEDTYRALPDPNKRALMGQSMGASGCFENGPKYKDKFRAIAAHGYSGVMEYCMDSWQTDLLNEQVSGPPYFFDFNSGGIFTKISFLQSGAVAPNLNCPQTHINPTTVEFILDDQGAFIDTIISKWLDHSGHKLVQELTPDDDFGILFGDGQNDELGFYPGSLALKDSLDAYGIPSQFFSHPGGHSMPTSFMQETYLFLDSIFNIVENSCLPEGITFTTQAQIDNFQINYPGCTEIEGDFTIYGIDISNLNGLSVLSSIGGNFFINGDENLNNLTGLDNLQTIGGSVSFGYGTMGGPACTHLVSLTGLENLNSIGGDLSFYCNILLQDLSELSGLLYIEGELWIYDNPELQSLAGLENIETGSISNLSINSNYQLSTCEVQSICDYLAMPGAQVSIYDNAPGCNSPEEVQEACLTSIEDISEDVEFNISPNPVTGYAEINLNSLGSLWVEISLYNTTGIYVKIWQFPQSQTGKNIFILDLKEIPAGLYFCRIQIGNEMVTKKIIKL